MAFIEVPEAIKLLNELASQAALEPLVCATLRGTAIHIAYAGREIPDRLLPGRFVMRLSPEQRGLLSELKSDDTLHADRRIIAYNDPGHDKPDRPRKPSTFKMPF